MQINARDSTNYAAIRPKHVLDIEIPLPPLDEQKRIVARIEKVEELKELQAETEKDIEELVPSILDKAFKGSI